MLFRHTRLVTCACFVLVLLLTAPGLAYAETVSLDDVLKGNVDGLKVKVRGHGGWYGKCMTGDFENTSGQEIIVTIPVGLKLVPPSGSEGVQTMICSGYETLVIPAGSSEQQFTAFCGEKEDGPPSGTSGFTSGGLASKEIIRALERINDEALFDSNAQAAIWSITDDLDVSDNPEAEQYLTSNNVPAGRALAAGLGVSLTGVALAETLRRLIGMGTPPGSEKPSDGGPPWGDDDGEGGYDEDSKDGEEKEKPPDSDEEKKKAQAAKKKDDDTDVLDELLEFEETDETPEEKAKRKKEDAKRIRAVKRAASRLPPQKRKPMGAGDEQGTFKWDRKKKKLTMTSPGSHVEIGKDDFYISPHAPGANPFALKPPSVLDLDDGKVQLKKAGDAFTVSAPSSGKDRWDLYHNAATGRTRLQKGFFVADESKGGWSVENLLYGKRTGVTYNGTKDQFELHRDRFKLFRNGEWRGVSDKSPTGRQYVAKYRSGSKSGFYGQVGDRWLTRDGDMHGYGWGKQSEVTYDKGAGRGSVRLGTHRQTGATRLTVGRDKQLGVERTQPVKVGTNFIRLRTSFTNYVRDNAAGGERTRRYGAGIDTGRVSIDWTKGGTSKVKFNLRF